MISVKGKTKVAFIFSDPRLAPWHGGIFLRLSMIPRSHENDLKTAKMWHGKRSQSKKGHGNSSAAQTSTEIHFLADDFLPDWVKAWLNKTPGSNQLFLGDLNRDFDLCVRQLLIIIIEQIVSWGAARKISLRRVRPLPKCQFSRLLLIANVIKILENRSLETEE